MALKRIEQVNFDRTFKMVPDDGQVYHLRNGTDPGKEVAPELRELYVLGVNCCVGNIQGKQFLLPWGTVVNEQE